MSDSQRNNIPAPVKEWARDVFDKAVQEIVESDLVTSAVIEARPAWVLEERVVLGQIRETDGSALSWWVICGDVPNDKIRSTVASTPREVVRHFSLKWHLDAERLSDSAAADQLRSRAEYLNELAENDDIWKSA